MNINFPQKIMNNIKSRQKRKTQMKMVREDIKQKIEELNNIQYQDIGEYQLPVNPSPQFSKGYLTVNFQYMDDTPVNIRALEIKKRSPQGLTKAEERELASYYRTLNRFQLAREAEDNRNARLAVSEAGKYLRAWI